MLTRRRFIEDMTRMMALPFVLPYVPKIFYSFSPVHRAPREIVLTPFFESVGDETTIAVAVGGIKEEEWLIPKSEEDTIDEICKLAKVLRRSRFYPTDSEYRFVLKGKKPDSFPTKFLFGVPCRYEEKV